MVPQTNIPFFSVIIPVYNREKYIETTLDSLFKQTFKDYEVIVCDDGSTDCTVDILFKYSNKLKIVKTDRAGPGGARNRAIKEATGKFLSFLDSDDCWSPWALETAYSQIINNEASFIWLSSITSESTPSFVPPDSYETLEGESIFDFDGEIAGASGWLAIDKEIFAKNNCFQEKMFIGEDTDFLFRAKDLGKIIHIKKPFLLWYRNHDAQSAQTATAKNRRRAGKVLYERWQDNLYFQEQRNPAANRYIVSSIFKKLSDVRGANLNERLDYIKCYFIALNNGVLNIASFPKHIFRAIFR